MLRWWKRHTKPHAENSSVYWPSLEFRGQEISYCHLQWKLNSIKVNTTYFHINSLPDIWVNFHQVCLPYEILLMTKSVFKLMYIVKRWKENHLDKWLINIIFFIKTFWINSFTKQKQITNLWYNHKVTVRFWQDQHTIISYF